MTKDHYKNELIRGLREAAGPTKTQQRSRQKTEQTFSFSPPSGFNQLFLSHWEIRVPAIKLSKRVCPLKMYSCDFAQSETTPGRHSNVPGVFDLCPPDKLLIHHYFGRQWKTLVKSTSGFSHLSLSQNRSNEEQSGGAKSNETSIYVGLSTSSYVCKIAP